VNYLELRDLSERYQEIANPVSPAKILRVGEMLGLEEGGRVIDLACGYGETLALWGERFGISGVGVEIRPQAVERARRKMRERGLESRVEIVQGDAAAYSFAPKTFDVAACIGATFIWKGFRGCLQALQLALKPGGRLAVGEGYFRMSLVDPSYAASERFPREHELLADIQAEGLDLFSLVRASRDDCDEYETRNWLGLVDWLRENPQHPNRMEVQAALRQWQEEYLRYGREFLGWAIYVLGKRFPAA
jgi:SAM-dependent methyltransferase